MNSISGWKESFMGISQMQLAATFLTLLSGVVATANAQERFDRIPEVVAARYIRQADVPNERVTFDSRILVESRKPRPTDERQSGQVVAAMARALDADIKDLEHVRSCDVKSYSCRFDNTKAVLTVSQAARNGATATVIVRLEIDHQPGKVKGQEMRQYSVELHQQSDVWSVRKATLVLTGR
jgi:hypothetical protein